MHFFVYSVCGSLCTEIICVPAKILFNSQYQCVHIASPDRSVAVRKFLACERLEVPSIRKFSAYEMFWIFSSVCAGGGGGVTMKRKCQMNGKHDK